MSLSKVYKKTALFVPEQILPRQGHPAKPGQHGDTGHSSSAEHHKSFIPDSTDSYEIISDQMPFPPEPPANEESTLPSEHLPSTGGAEEEPPTPVLDVEEIRQQAFIEGVQEGRRQADEDFGTCVNTLRFACHQLNNLHETILRNNLDEMHSLVLQIAEKIIRHSVTEQSETILATIEDAIRLAVKSEEFQIRVNPDDLEAIKQKKNEILEEISGLENITLKADSAIDRGGCILESANCTVDATITGQLEVIQEALQSTPDSSPVTATLHGEP